MARIKRKYIDSHWLIFVIQGALALGFGWVMLFSSTEASISYLVSIVGVFLLALGILELFNILHREHLKAGWSVSLIVALFDTIVAMTLLMTINNDAVWHLVIIAAYTFARGIFEILIGLRSPDDMTDRFIWVLVGACGVVMGLVVFNSGNMGLTDFVRFFGAYMMVLGVGSLVYGVHNRDQKLDDLSARREARAKAAKKVDPVKVMKSQKVTKAVRAGAKPTKSKTTRAKKK